MASGLTSSLLRCPQFMTQFLLEDLQCVEANLVGSPGWGWGASAVCRQGPWAERQPCPHPQDTWGRETGWSGKASLERDTGRRECKGTDRGGIGPPGFPELTVLEALHKAVGASPNQLLDSLPPSLPFPPQVSSSPSTAVGADETITWYSGTCATTRRGPNPSAGAATSTSAPSLSECQEGRGARSHARQPGLLQAFSEPWPWRKGCGACFLQPVAQRLSPEAGLPEQRAAHARLCHGRHCPPVHPVSSGFLD